ncbi:extracellular matrix protein FRAS1 [Geobacter sp. OR-1]|nr:extracellular matrix protein FRAS1 [Geobacter sp. OR-1]
MEGNEDFTVTLSAPTGGASLGSPSSAAVTIVDNDVASAGTIALSASAYSIGEAGPTVTITATRTGGSSGAVGISYATSDGSATSGNDYSAASGTLSWGSGDTASKTFTVGIIDDADVDPNEAFTVTLSSPTGGASLGSPSSAAVTIIDNEGPPASTSTLMHNSANTSITYGTWGTDKNCSWCHNRDTANVKRIAQTIDTPYGTQQVIFTRMTASQNSTSGVFGDDQRSYALTASTNVCEVCHHKTKYHRYSSNSTYSGTTFTKTHENRNDCLTCHAHKNGFMAACDSCHGNPPNSSVAGPKGMAKDGSNTTGFANPGAHVVHAGDPLLGNQGMACSVCHNGNSTPSHPSQTVQFGFVVNNSTWNAKFIGSNSASYGSYSGTGLTAPFTYATSDSGTVVITNAGSRNSCNVYCHGAWPNANGTTNPTWTGGASQAACGTCHGDRASRPPLTGSHLQHAANSAGNYGFSCSKCHPNVSGAGDGHVNGSVQWRLSTGSNLIGVSGFTPQYRTGASGATGTTAPSTSFGNCTNIYCHSAGQGATGGNLIATDFASVQWGNGASVNCGSCHKNIASDATAPGDHVRHSQNYGYSCGTCHKGSSATSVTVANHVNRTIYLNFSGQAAGTTYGKTSPFAPSLGYSSCGNSYCHSNGQSNDAKTAIKRTVTWGIASGLDCGGCHNNMASFANASSGSHKVHAQTAAYTCDICHGASYGNATVPRQTNSTHVNKKINLAWTGKATGLTYSKYSASGFAPAKGYYGTCSNLVCHGGAAAKITWGADTARPECMKCHGSNSASFTNVSAAAIAPGYNNEGHDLAGNTNSTAARVGTHQGHLTAATGISDTVHCGECHVKVSNVADLAHLDYTTATVTMTSGRGSLQSHTPRVSRTSGAINCSNTYCHTGKTNTGNAMTPAFNNTAYLNATMDMASCKQCHNMPPNPGAVGDHSTVPAALTAFPVNNSCNCHSNLSTSATTYANIFTDKKKHIDGVVDVDGGHVTPYYAGYTYNEGHQGCLTGIGCHQNTNPAATYPAASGAPDCRSCHKKADPTVTATCASCHGTGINNAAVPSGSTAPDRAGSHAKHMALASATCTGCHDTGGAGGMANHGPGDHGANAAVINVASAQAWSSGAHTCSTSYCHSSAQSKNGTNTGIHYSATPSWLSPSTLTCGGCHANMATFNNISSGDHQRHSKEYAFQCYYCHGTGYKAASVTDGAINTHVNGQINMAFAPLSSALPAYGTTYSKTSPFNPGIGFGTCSNSYCHSNGQSSTARAAIKRANVSWGPTLGCGGCHNDMATFANTTSGSHYKHANTGQLNYDCSLCHGASYGDATVPRTANSTHVNKKINLGFTGTASGTVYSKYSASGFAPAKGYYGTCSTSVCHGGALAKKPWGVSRSTTTCTECHGQANYSYANISAAQIAPGGAGTDLAGNTAATALRVGTHQGHLTAATGISEPVHCGECHVKVTVASDTTTHLNYTTATVTMTSGRGSLQSHTPTVSRSSGAITCNNTYCHTGKYNTGAGMIPAFNNNTYLNSTLDMASCKQCHNMPPATSDHTGISNLANFPAATCSCHTNLNSGASPTYANIFSDKKQHINGVIEYASSCTGCHAATVGGSPSPANSRRQVAASGANNGEFTVASGSKYTNMTSHIKTTAVSDLSCQFCHATTSAHKAYADGISVRLQNTWAAGTIDYNGTTASLTYFCAGCHRSAGYGGSIPSGATGTATQPYKDSGVTASPDNIFSDWSSSAQYTATSAEPTSFTSTGNTKVRYTHRKAAQCMDCHGDNRTNTTTTPRANAHASSNGKFLRYSTSAGRYETQTCFNTKNAAGVNACHGPGTTLAWAGAKVYTEFKVNNAAAGTGGAHPILQAVTPKSTNIASDTTGTRFVNGWKSNSIATCSDCHGGTTTGPRGPHGSTLPFIIKAAPTTSPTKTTSGTTFTAVTQNSRAFCLNCHAA